MSSWIAESSELSQQNGETKPRVSLSVLQSLAPNWLWSADRCRTGYKYLGTKRGRRVTIWLISRRGIWIAREMNIYWPIGIWLDMVAEKTLEEVYRSPWKLKHESLGCYECSHAVDKYLGIGPCCDCETKPTMDRRNLYGRWCLMFDEKGGE